MALTNWLSVFLSFTTRKLTMKAVWDVKTSTSGKFILKLFVKVYVTSLEIFDCILTSPT